MKNRVLISSLKKHGLEVSDSITDDQVVHRKSFDVVVGKELGDKQTFLTVMSTPTPDADGEVILPEGIDTSEYTKNPVLLWQHDRTQPAIGKCTQTMVDNRGLMGSFVLAPTQFATEVWQLVKGKFLSTVSIGFIPLETYVRGQPGFDAACRKFGVDVMNKAVKIITPRSLLLECSVVNLPANREAVILAAKDLKLEAFEKACNPDKPEDKPEEKVVEDKPIPEVVVPEVVVEEVKPDEKKPIVFTVLRNGPYISTEDDKAKALLVIAGKIL
jgi:HK97 family phage prohead protease